MGRWLHGENSAQNEVNEIDLSTENYSTDEKTKLAGIALGAQVNVIEGVKVNGTALPPTNKVVNIDAAPSSVVTRVGTLETHGYLMKNESGVYAVFP